MAGSVVLTFYVIVICISGVLCNYCVARTRKNIVVRECDCTEELEKSHQNIPGQLFSNNDKLNNDGDNTVSMWACMYFFRTVLCFYNSYPRRRPRVYV